MEQQQFKVSFSVGTKLLISVLALLTGVIAFLNVSAIFLLREDKRAYTYQAQSTNAVLAGREFVNSARHEVDALRQALGAVDPTQGIGPQRQSVLQTLVDNQSDLLGLSLGLVTLEGGPAEFESVARAFKDKDLKAAQLSATDLEPSTEALARAAGDLAKNGYAFLNLSRTDGAPALGIAVIDRALLKRPGGTPMALGLASLREFGSELGGLNLSVATKSGWVLFDTDTAALYARRNIKADPIFAAALGSKLTSGASEYETDGTKYVGSYVQPGLDLLVFSKVEWKKAIRATYELLIKFALLGLMAIGVALVFAILFSKTLTAPINRLYRATREVAQGNFALNLEIRGRDEIGALTSSFNLMSHQISELISAQADKIHLENELAIASTVQQTLIPPEVFRNPDIYIHSHYQAASQCGGDWWGFFGVGRKICIMIADATGHGMPSALITASARSCVSMLHKLAQEDSGFSFSPSAMLAYANRVVHDASATKIMMTFFCAVIDFDTMTMTYSSAGHNPPWLFRKEGDAFTLKSLTAQGQRLGEAREVDVFEELQTEIGPGDLLFLYTDGLMEGTSVAAAGDEKEMYGKKRVRKSVESFLANGPEAVVKGVIREFLAFNGDKSLDDDVTIAVAQVLGGRPVA